MRGPLSGAVRPLCVSSLLTPVHPTPAPAARGRELAERKAEQLTGFLLPGPQAASVGCQAPGQRLGRETADSRLVLMLADSPGQPCKHHQTRYLGGPGGQAHLGAGSQAAWEPTAQGICGQRSLPSFSARPLPMGLFPENPVLQVGPGASIWHPAVLFRCGCSQKHP